MELMAKILGMNTSDGLYNLMVSDSDEQTHHLKISSDMADGVKLGHTYLFHYSVQEGTERNTFIVSSFEEITELPLEKQDEALRQFYPQAPLSLRDALAEVNRYLEEIRNPVIQSIARHLMDKHRDSFFIYPAASKLHHAYVGGLAYHSIGMLHLAQGFIENYPYLNRDYVYAGILLHDIGKTIELTGAVNTEYSLKGQLIGHLVLGAMEVEQAAKELGYEDTEEVLLLEHMLISHHGQPQFGSAKKPMTAEAMVLWYIDTIDSKFRVLGEELAKTPSGSYTENIGVLDRTKIYKP